MTIKDPSQDDRRSLGSEEHLSTKSMKIPHCKKDMVLMQVNANPHRQL